MGPRFQEIRQDMTKYISSRGTMAFEETFKAAGLFKKRTGTVIAGYGLD
jgi:hypothetical protein